MQAGRVRRSRSVIALALAGLTAACAPWPPPPLPPPPVVPPPPPAPPPPATAIQSYTVTAPLHLRQMPGVGGVIIGTLAPGISVETTGSIRGMWWEVQTPEGTGWVSSHYLRPS